MPTVSLIRSIHDLSGKQFGRLVVLSLFGRSSVGECVWRCLCSCGKQTNVKSQKLRLGYTKSCGCLRIQMRRYVKIHGMRNSREYETWCRMIARCTNPKTPEYHNYGGKGVKLCHRWRSEFLNFFRDMGPRPAGMSIDRINCAGDYEPDNCRWATRLQQNRNRRKRRWKKRPAVVL